MIGKENNIELRSTNVTYNQKSAEKSRKSLAKFKFFDLNNKINHELEKERQVDKKKLIKKIKSKDFWVPNNHFSKFNDYERPIIINNSFHQPNTTSNEPRIDYSDDIHISIIDFKK